MDMLSTILLIITILATLVATYNFYKVLKFEKEHERILNEIDKVLNKANQPKPTNKVNKPKEAKPIPTPVEEQEQVNVMGFKVGDREHEGLSTDDYLRMLLEEVRALKDKMK